MKQQSNSVQKKELKRVLRKEKVLIAVRDGEEFVIERDLLMWRVRTGGKPCDKYFGTFGYSKRIHILEKLGSFDEIGWLEAHLADGYTIIDRHRRILFSPEKKC